jgi:hypothetical protein
VCVCVCVCVCVMIFCTVCKTLFSLPSRAIKYLAEYFQKFLKILYSTFTSLIQRAIFYVSSQRKVSKFMFAHSGEQWIQHHSVALPPAGLKAIFSD